MERIIEILDTLDRPGMDKVIQFMRENNYVGSSCYESNLRPAMRTEKPSSRDSMTLQATW